MCDVRQVKQLARDGGMITNRYDSQLRYYLNVEVKSGMKNRIL